MNTSNFSFTPMKKIILLLLAVSIGGFFHSCVKEQDIDQTDIVLPFAKELVQTNIFGLVVDENDQPMVNSEVLLKTEKGFETTTTDDNGNFLYRDVRVERDGAFVKVRQTGKFEGFRKMNVTPNSYNYTKIKLLDKTIVGEISSNSGGTVSHSSSAKLKLPANAVRYEGGGEYTGTVSVAMNWIDPTANDLQERMVGDLSGVDSEGKEVYLGTYGMLNVELLAENGEELQLKNGTPATLSFPVPSEIRSQAPETIPLWSYNEDQGVWLEEGSASLQNGFYVGDVAHFSSWNCDYKGERITVTGKVVSRNNVGEDVATPFLQIFVTIEDVFTKGGYLDNSGEFEFYNFAANEVFTLTIKDRCDNIIFEEQYGPYANDTDLGTIIVQATADNFITISGSGIDCEDNAITDGYINFELDKLTFFYPLESDATFEFVVNVCDETSGEISVLDIPNEKISPVQTVDLTDPTVELGALKACDELPSFIDVKVSGENFGVYYPASATVSTNLGNTFLNISSELIEEDSLLTSIRHITLGVNNISGVGIYTGNNNGVANDDPVSGYWGNQTQEEDWYNLIGDVSTIEITEYGTNPGDVIRGTFVGEATTWDSNTGDNLQVPVSGIFKAIMQ